MIKSYSRSTKPEADRVTKTSSKVKQSNNCTAISLLHDFLTAKNKLQI